MDDEPVHCRMFQRVLWEEGIVLSTKDYYRFYLGYNDKDCFSLILKKHGRAATRRKIADLIDRKTRYYRAYITSHLIFLPGARSFVRRAARRYPLAIVSGALREEVVYVLRRGGLEKYFQVIVAAQDTKKGKPHPEGFQKALSELNRTLGLCLRPEECLVFEDSLEGIKAAKKAGMHCFALATSYPASKLRGADKVATGFTGNSVTAYVIPN